MPWTSEHTKWLVDTGERLKTADIKEVEVREFRHEKDEAVLSAWAKDFRNHYCLDYVLQADQKLQGKIYNRQRHSLMQNTNYNFLPCILTEECAQSGIEINNIQNYPRLLVLIYRMNEEIGADMEFYTFKRSDCAAVPYRTNSVPNNSKHVKILPVQPVFVSKITINFQNGIAPSAFEISKPVPKLVVLDLYGADKP